MSTSFIDAFITGYRDKEQRRQFNVEQERLERGSTREEAYRQETLRQQAARDVASNLANERQYGLNQASGVREQRRLEAEEALKTMGLISGGDAVEVPNAGVEVPIGQGDASTMVPAEQFNTVPFAGRKFAPTTPEYRTERAAQQTQRLEQQKFFAGFENRRQVAEQYLSDFTPDERNRFAVTGNLPGDMQAGEFLTDMLIKGRRAGVPGEVLWKKGISILEASAMARSMYQNPTQAANLQGAAIADRVVAQLVQGFNATNRRAPGPQERNALLDSAFAEVNKVTADPAARAAARDRIDGYRLAAPRGQFAEILEALGLPDPSQPVARPKPAAGPIPPGGTLILPPGAPRR